MVERSNEGFDGELQNNNAFYPIINIVCPKLQHRHHRLNAAMTCRDVRRKKRAYDDADFDEFFRGATTKVAEDLARS